MHFQFLKKIDQLWLIIANDHFVTSLTLVNQLKRDNPSSLTQKAIKQLDEYLEGERHQFDLPFFIPDTFRGNVLKTLMENVGYGNIITYKKLADLAGTKAVRAVGTAMATNPLPIFIPCHRVIRSNGSIGNYYYGSEMKQSLQALEQKFLAYKSTKQD